MKAGQGRLAAMEIARALSEIPGFEAHWYPKAVTEVRGFVGIIYVMETQVDPVFAKQSSPQQTVTWILEASGPTDATSSGSEAEAEILDLLSSAVATPPVAIMDAVHNHTAPRPTGWGDDWRDLQPRLHTTAVYRKEEADMAGTIIRCEIRAEL